MGYKKTGVIAFIALVLLALVIYGLSRVSVTKTQSKPSTKSSDVKSSEVTSEPTSKKDTSSTKSEDTSQKSEDASSDTESTAPELVSGWTEVNTSSISYSSREISETGSVLSKRAFLTDANQVVYLVQIKVDGKDLVLDYYCGYNAFSSVVKNEKVTVVYKTVSKNGANAVLSIEKK